MRVFENIDCIDGIRRYPARFFDLAIVDPMYDLPDVYLCQGNKVSKTGVTRKHIDTAKKLAGGAIVCQDYFTELLRVSKHQIIWGEQYFQFQGKPKGRLIWDKCNDASSFSNAEIASCDLLDGVRIFRYMWNGMIQADMKHKEKRIHPFQKPVPLYRWILKRFAEPGFKLLDTHVGSASSLIAFEEFGLDYAGFEIDGDIYHNAVNRLEQYRLQPALFGSEEMWK